MTEAPGQEGYSHEAYFYADEDDYLGRALPFVEAGIESGEPVLLALPERKRELLRGALDDRADQVDFMPMEQASRNPSRLISVWRDFLQGDLAIWREAGAQVRLRMGADGVG